MEQIRSRKNQYILHLRALGKSGDARREVGEYVCDGEKLLREALRLAQRSHPCSGAIRRRFRCRTRLRGIRPMPNSSSMPRRSCIRRGLSLLVRIPEMCLRERLRHVIVLEGVQDPGNVGTVIRTANALGMDAVVLTGRRSLQPQDRARHDGRALSARRF